MFRWGLIALALFSSAPALSQSFPLIDPQYGVGTLNADRLFSESKFGQTFIADFDKRAAQLAEQNREIEGALEAEELELTRLRNVEAPENFEELAEAFNQKANRIRNEQRQKSQDLLEFRGQSQQVFFNQVGPILIELMNEKRIAIIIEREAVVISLPNIDLTDDAIKRIDEVFSK